MNKLITLVALFMLSIPAIAAEDHEHKGNPFLTDDHYPAGYFLMPNSMPHFMGIYMKKGGKKILKPTKEQHTKISAYAKKIVINIMSKATKAKNIEEQIAKAVIFEGKTADDLASQIDEVAKLKRELTVIHLKCLNFFKATLDKDRYHILVELAENKAGKEEKHSHGHKH